MQQQQRLQAENQPRYNSVAGLTIVPVSILAYRAKLGAAQPTDVFLPILLATTLK